jgi:hypothetical protein
MKKEIMIIIAIILILIIGSFVGMVSSTATEEELNDSCLDDCDDCDSKCNDSNNCNSQGDNFCDGKDSCTQNKQRQGNCKLNSDCSGSCRK